MTWVSLRVGRRGDTAVVTIDVARGDAAIVIIALNLKKLAALPLPVRGYPASLFIDIRCPPVSFMQLSCFFYRGFQAMVCGGGGGGSRMEKDEKADLFRSLLFK